MDPSLRQQPLPTYCDLRNQYASLLQNHQRLRQEYQKLLSVTSELTAGLETVAMSKPGNTQPIDWKKVTSKIIIKLTKRICAPRS